MREQQGPEPSENPRVVVTVVRSGGIGGMRRQWRAEPSADDEPRWAALIDSCPWDDVGSDPEGADRFVWRIAADREGDEPRAAEVPDSRLDGPWRTLVDAVRSARRD